MADQQGNTPRQPASAHNVTRARRRFKIETDEFSPRVDAGEFVEVEECAPAAGDEVFAETVEGGQVLGRVIWLDGGALTLAHPCDGRRLEVTVGAGRCWPVVALWRGAQPGSPTGRA